MEGANRPSRLPFTVVMNLRGKQMKGIEVTVADKEDVRHLSASELSRMGVRLTDAGAFKLQCVTCGETWEPQLESNGKLSFEYWICPAKCNKVR
jgi:hypothetical protein